MNQEKNIISINSTIAEEFLGLASKQGTNFKFSEEIMHLLVSTLKRKSTSKEIKRIITKTFGFLKKHPEIYPELVTVYKTTKEDLKTTSLESSLAFLAAESMLTFEEKIQESKNIFLESLRDSKLESGRFAAVHLLGHKFTEIKKEIKPILQLVMRDDPSKKVRREAWHRFIGLASNEEVNAEKEALKREKTYNAVYDVLTKVQPGLQINIQRIIELSDQIYFSHAEEMRNFGIDMKKYDELEYINIIQQILDNKNLQGKYFDYEQVFVRDTKKNVPVITPVSLSKNYLCFNCGNPIEIDTKVCSSCKKKILKCTICKQPINFGQEIGKCTYCESAGHFAHLAEWVKVNGKCPTCKKGLKQEEVVPITAMEVKL